MTKFEEELSNLPVSIITNYGDYWNKSQLLTVFKDWQPQQALPVVPECVAGTVELLKKNPESSWSKLYNSLGEEGVDWLNEFQHKDERFGFGELNSKLIVLFHLAINGFTVEKPQLFYLRDELTGQFLAKDNQFKDKDRYFFWTGADPLTHSIGTAWKLTFTQQEIDSMQTGNYEQIEVVE